MRTRFLVSRLALPIAAFAGGIAAFPSGAAVIGVPDRLTLAAWAAGIGQDELAIERRYAATGVVTCQWDDPVYGPRTSIASGQVTGRTDTLTLSGHTFLDPVTCLPKAAAGGCSFTTTVNGETMSAGLADVLEIGIDCRPAARQALDERLRNDWAVVRLDREMAVVPYTVPGAELALSEGAAILSVTHSQDYLVLTAEGAESHPKTIGACAVRDIKLEGNLPVYFATDCDGAQRSSGGSVLSSEAADVPLLVGIWAASSEDRFLLDAAMLRIVGAGGYRDDLANRGEYEVNRWSSRHVPVAGAFLAAIQAAIDPAAR